RVGAHGHAGNAWPARVATGVQRGARQDRGDRCRLLAPRDDYPASSAVDHHAARCVLANRAALWYPGPSPDRHLAQGGGVGRPVTTSDLARLDVVPGRTRSWTGQPAL